MSIYLIALNHPDEAAWDRLKSKWPKHHRIVTDRLAFIAPEEITITEEVGESVGMNSEHKVLGVVAEIQYGTINGWNRQSLWEWMGKHQ